MPTGLSSTEKGKNHSDERHSFIDNLTDSQSEMSKTAEEISLGDSTAGWQGVYRPTTVTIKYERKKGFSKYKETLKHLLPVRIRTGPGTMMPVDQTGCIAFSLFSWITPLMWRAFRRGLTSSDMYQCSPVDGSRANGARFSSHWDEEVKVRGLHAASLSSVIRKFIRTRIIFACLAYVCCLGFGFLGPTIFLRNLLDSIGSHFYEEKIKWIVGVFLTEFFRIYFLTLFWGINTRTAIRASAGVMTLLYRKVMRLRVVACKSAGELINYFANDTQKVFLMVHQVPLVIGGPLVVIGSVTYTWYLIGPYALISVAVFMFTYSLQVGISRLSLTFRKNAIKATDERVSLVADLLTYVKLVKLYAWEQPFSESVSDLRDQERNLLEKGHYFQVFSTSISVLTPVLANIFTILTYTLTAHSLSAAEAFTLVMANHIASHGIKTLPMCIKDIVNGKVAIKRLQSILQLEEKENYSTLPSNPENAVYISKATLSWEQSVPSLSHKRLKPTKGELNLSVTDTEKVPHPDPEASADTALVSSNISASVPALLDISFVMKRGSLVGVCGQVGSGKSSLIGALLGQMHLRHGQVSVRGLLAYVPQHPWILNSSIRENILFGLPFLSKRYYEAVYCCSLTEDIAALPGGDETEVGERGVTLSGGQKQRISLARALYSDAELYLLDDPLSCVDASVARHIFQHYIKGALRGKSVIFVTHQLQYIQECDEVVLMHGGKIIEQGTDEELKSKGGEYAALIKSYVKKEEEMEDRKLATVVKGFSRSVEEFETRAKVQCHSRSTSTSFSVSTSLSDIAETNIADVRLMTEEEIKQGDISFDTYRSYILAAGGYMVSFLVLIWFILQAASIAFSNWWLSYWLSQGSGGNSSSNGVITDNADIEFYQLVYGLSVCVMITIGLILGYLFTKTTMKAASTLHDNLFSRIFRSPMHFFDTVPCGRILNIFTRDVDEVDSQLPVVMDAFLQRVMIIFFNLLLIAFVSPWFLVVLAILLVGFALLHRIFRVALRDLKRQENVTRSPIYSHISASADGLATICAYQKQEDFVEKFCQLVDTHSSPHYLYHSSIRWLGCRMDALSVVIILVITVLVVVLEKEVGAAYAGLAIAVAMQLSGIFQYAVRLGCDLETRFTSVERINSYIQELESEAPPILENNRPSPDWPTRGRISFRRVCMRYRPGLPLVLKELTFDISPQEKIGIVGRTGAGKSSIGAVLFRLTELTSGTIHIDGVDISKLGLEDLRSRMSVIPQDPVLFHGTVRYNLDPFQRNTDKEMWEALEKTHMKEKVMLLDGGLDASVVEHGANFSVGERQLLCMARAFLRCTKVLLLDEATAAIDLETDHLIQKTIKEVFAESTVLIIAHRLSTVLNCDRVMVLQEGKIVEFEDPSVLSGNPQSTFTQMLSDRSTSRL
ncbi:LOW QUALITY PROTEIN: ATP-binding cassette sub-family C member 5-like [Tachypleus tridentatus]|uniref:LOW QUALITY PROTEIN: ATP-binding cassette sub-family C member 5-like n=1 Tax=Tachypleus tridentatus TaxID=6853 RepID=UPI003FD1E061